MFIWPGTQDARINSLFQFDLNRTLQEIHNSQNHQRGGGLMGRPRRNHSYAFVRYNLFFFFASLGFGACDFQKFFAMSFQDCVSAACWVGESSWKAKVAEVTRSRVASNSRERQFTRVAEPEISCSAKRNPTLAKRSFPGYMFSQLSIKKFPGGNFFNDTNRNNKSFPGSVFEPHTESFPGCFGLDFASGLGPGSRLSTHFFSKVASKSQYFQI